MFSYIYVNVKFNLNWCTFHEHEKTHVNFFIYPSWWIGRKKEIARLENEVVISEIVFIVHGQPYKGFEKIPHIPISITCH